MTPLPHVTLVIVDTVNYALAIKAINKSLEQITPARVVFFTDIGMNLPGIDVINIKHLYSKDDYSQFMIKELGKYKFTTSHMLVIQADGYVLDGDQWTDEFLKYDYVGSPWLYIDGRNVGNGGFSLRSVELHKFLATDEFIQCYNNEDDVICRMYRGYLEKKYHCTFAPEKLAHRFAFELHQPKHPTFGFHSFFHKPYVEPIVIKRTAAMGDVIQTEPVLEYFYRKGHPVYLDTLPGFYELFAKHYFPVGFYEHFDKTVIKHRVINLDEAYEVNPKQLHLKSYFEFAGVTDYKLRNPRLNVEIGKNNKIFEKYAVIHIDDRDTPHRNTFGIDWDKVTYWLEDHGYTVIQIGLNEAKRVGLKFNAVGNMLQWIIAGADIFIGIDSGPSHIAVATERKCVLLFGSVNPSYIHADMQNIQVIQSPCPIQKDGCWHSVIGNKGVVCEVDENRPPCCVHSTDEVIGKIKRLI